MLNYSLKASSFPSLEQYDQTLSRCFLFLLVV
jgi:hypothetical protein